MAIKINVSNKVGFRVKGTCNDVDGKEQDFDFGITANRLKEAKIHEIQASLVIDAVKTGNHALVNKFLADDIVTNWADVQDDDAAPVPYVVEAFDGLCNTYKGLGLLIWQHYVANAGAKAKN